MSSTRFTTLTTLIALTGLLSIPASSTFTFNFTSPPAQCASTTVQWSSGGRPPFRLLLVPTGHIDPEIRVIADFTIRNGSSFTFPLKYPENSTFVAVMSDATGFGAGGTTDVVSVAASRDTSCLVSKTQVAPEFFMFTSPSVPQECTPMNISYSADAKPPVDIFAVIPNGASSRIKTGSPANNSFVWVPALPSGSRVILVAGDATGAGKGGSTDILTVAAPAANSTSCLPPVTTSPAPFSPTPRPSSAFSRWNISMWPMLLCAALAVFG